MSLAAPLALAWAALAVPIVIFYILKIRLRQVPVSTTIFWRQIYDEKKPRSIWQQLRHLLSLLVQLLLLMLLVLALAEPFFSWEVLQAKRVILVIDNSASMNSSDVATSRLAEAKKLGSQLISGLRFRDEMAIVAAAAQPRVVCGLTAHERTLQDALASVAPSDGPTGVAAAVALGRRLLADAKHGRVIVLSDGCFAESEKLAGEENIDLRTVGTRAGNVGITSFQVRRSLLDPVGYEILAEVTNASDEEVKCRLELDIDESPVDVFPLSLSPGQTWSQTVEKTSVDGGKLEARLKWDDALPADNKAVAILPKREVQKVLLVTEGNLFLRTALLVNPLVNLKIERAPPTTWDPSVLYVFHRHAPVQMPAVNALVIDPVASSDLWKAGEKLADPIVSKQDQDSPLMRHVRLDNVLLPEARQITPPEGAVPLATALSGDPLYFSLVRGDRKLLVLTVNLDQGDLTFRTAFPIMMTNALGWFAGQSGELREALAAGSVAEISLPAAGSESDLPLALQSPSGRLRALPAEATKTSVGPLDECGLWKVVRTRADAKDGRAAVRKVAHDAAAEPAAPILELACNLGSRAESDIRVPQQLLDLQQPSPLASNWLTRPIWFYLVLLAWALAAVEWYLYQRRWIS